MNLGARLKAVADFVPPGAVVADIGTDHAYLPIYLVRRRIALRALACDVHFGPYQAAQKAVLNANLAEAIEVRLGDGITVLQPGEAEVAAIAGMGGATIVDILAKCPETTARFDGLILQPMNAAAPLRRWLTNNRWKIADEALVLDEERLYEVLYATPGEEAACDALLFEIGPRLWEKRPPLLKRHISRLIERSRRVLAGMAASETAKSSEKYRRIAMKIAALEEKLSCL